LLICFTTEKENTAKIWYLHRVDIQGVPGGM